MDSFPTFSQGKQAKIILALEFDGIVLA